MSVIDDATLLKMAEAEILGEAKRAAVRHSIAGISGWQPCPKPNKIFLRNTLLHTMASNRVISRKKNEKKGTNASKCKKKERKLLQKSEKSGRTNFIFQKPTKSKENSDNLQNAKKKSEFLTGKKPSSSDRDKLHKHVKKEK